MWAPRTTEIAKRLWLEGQSASQIVAALKAERVSVTRNAVIGKLHRLGITSKSRQDGGREATRVRNLMASRRKERVAATNQAKGALARRRNEAEAERPKPVAKAFRVHVCVIAHPTKSVKDGDGNYKMPTLYDIAGSANWYNKADLGVIVHKDTLEYRDDPYTLIKVQKSRYHEVIGTPGEVFMDFSKDARRFEEVQRGPK